MNRENQDNSLPGKAPGFWYYPGDFERDCQMLSLAAQGLWIRMLGWMHENEAHRGFLELPTGEPMTVRDIAMKVGRPVGVVEKLVAEIERAGILSRGESGTIFNRRMARTSVISDARRNAARKRLEAAHRAANGSFAPTAGGRDPQVLNSRMERVSSKKSTQNLEDTTSVCELRDTQSIPGSQPGHSAESKCLNGFHPAADGTFAGDFAPAKRPAKHQQNPSVQDPDPDPDTESSTADAVAASSRARAASKTVANGGKPRGLAAAATGPPKIATAEGEEPAEPLVLALMPAHSRHGPSGPVPRAVREAGARLARARDPAAKTREYRDRHAAWCRWWEGHRGGFVPHLWRWFADGDCEFDPPPEELTASRREPVSETMRLMLEAQAEEDAKAARRAVAC